MYGKKPYLCLIEDLILFSRVAESHEPSYRTPFRKKVGVPSTPLLIPSFSDSIKAGA
jgi:hypothetical protein